MTDEVDPFTKRTIDELDTMWQELAKVEIIAIKSATTANVMAARQRAHEQKLLRLEGENADLRALVARLEEQQKG
jgi:IS1 family transposase